MGSSATDTDRDVSTYLDIEGDLSQVPSLTEKFSFDHMRDVLEDLTDNSAQNGIRLFWRVILEKASTTNARLTFRTFINQPGQDRGSTSLNPMVFSLDRGNLADPEASNDWSEVITHVYVLGAGQGSERKKREVSDASRLAGSPWRRLLEESYEDRRLTDNNTMDSKGNAILHAQRERKESTGRIIAGPNARFGVDWAVGWRVVLQAFGEQVDALVSPVVITVRGSEVLFDARLRGVQ